MEAESSSRKQEVWVICCAGCHGNILYKEIEADDRASPLRLSQVIRCPYCDASYNYGGDSVFRGIPDPKHAEGAGNVIAISAAMICAVWFAREPEPKGTDIRIQNAVSLARKIYMKVRSEFPGLF